MEIMHHFGIKLSSEEDRQAFVDIGIALEPGARFRNGPEFTSLKIGEGDPRWKDARELAARFQITDFPSTRFDHSEIEAATALCMLATSHRGYPEPSEGFGFLDATFDLSDYCYKCGIGGRQIRPFRLKSAPVLKRSVMQLNWVFDEFFVARDVWSAVFEPQGIDYWPVVLASTGEVVHSVVQIKIDLQVNLKLQENNTTTCPHCSRSKRLFELKGFCPAPAEIPAPILKSSQYFGSDGAAFRRVLVSSSLRQEIKDKGLRGLDFYPCRPDSAETSSSPQTKLGDS
jgi:hypothetical protein